MEYIPNYDESDTTQCVKCGVEICKYDNLNVEEGYLCEDCIEL